MRAPSLFVTSLLVLLVACAEGATGAEGDEGSSGSPAPPGSTASLPPASKDASAPPADATADAPSSDGGEACAAALAKIAFDFEAGPQGFTHAISDGVAPPPDWPFDPWSHGSATSGTPCKAGKCFGAELTKNYAQCQRGELVSPPIDLSACNGRSVSLVFQHAYAYWTGTYGGQTWFDGGVVEVSGDDGATWVVPQGTYPGTVMINPDRAGGYECVQKNGFGVHGKQGFVGKQTTTTRAELALPANVVGASKVRVRFSVASGVSSSTTSPDGSRNATDFGWRVDEIGFVAK
jgi:hypothetical protein